MLPTERLHLLRPSETSAAAVLQYEVVNRDYFTPWVPQRDESWFDLSAQARRLTIEDAEERAGRSYRFFLTLKSDSHRVVGDVGISNVVRGAFHSAYLGYKMDEHHQRQGYMKEAIQRIIQYTFEALQLHRLEANIMPRNMRSIALVESLDFSLEGYSPRYLCINGEWEDHLRFARTVAQFRDGV